MNEKTLTNKLVGGALTLTVGIILVASLVVPIVADASNDQYEVFNNSAGRYAKIVDGSLELDYTFSNVAGSAAEANGEPITLPLYNASIVTADTFMLKYYEGGSKSNYLCYWDGSSAAIVYDVESMHVSAAENHAIIQYVKSGASSTLELDYTWLFHIANTGDYRTIWQNPGVTTVYVHDLSEIYGANWITATVQFMSFNGEEFSINGNATTGDSTLSETRAIDVYSIEVGENSSDFSVTIDNAGTPYVVHPFLIIVPYEVVGKLSTSSDAISSLYWTIPVMILVALIIVATNMIRSREY